MAGKRGQSTIPLSLEKKNGGGQYRERGFKGALPEKRGVAGGKASNLKLQEKKKQEGMLPPSRGKARGGGGKREEYLQPFCNCRKSWPVAREGWKKERKSWVIILQWRGGLAVSLAS